MAPERERGRRRSDIPDIPYISPSTTSFNPIPTFNPNTNAPIITLKIMITSDTSSVTTSEVVTKSDYVKYLNSYESMVRQQDLEFEATSEHVQLIFRKIQTLGCSSSGKKTHLDDDGSGVEDHHSSEENNNDTAPSGMLTYLQIRRQLLV